MAREIGVNLACEATNERGQEFIVDINCPRMSDIRRPFAIDRVAREQEEGEGRGGGRRGEKTHVLVRRLLVSSGEGEAARSPV